MNPLNHLRKLAGITESTQLDEGVMYVHLDDQELRRIQEMFLSLATAEGKQDALDPLWSERLPRVLAEELKRHVLTTDFLQQLWKKGRLQSLVDEVPF